MTHFLLRALLVAGLPVVLLWAAALSLVVFFSEFPDPNAPAMVPSALGVYAIVVNLPSLAVWVVAGMAGLVVRSAARTGYTPRSAERGLAALLTGLAIEHLVLAAAILVRGVRGWEGAIVLTAPAYVLAELAVGLAVLSGRRWARPALVTVATSAVVWTAFVSYILADVAFRTPTFAPGIGPHLLAILVALIAAGAIAGAVVSRRVRPA